VIERACSSNVGIPRPGRSFGLLQTTTLLQHASAIPEQNLPAWKLLHDLSERSSGKPTSFAPAWTMKGSGPASFDHLIGPREKRWRDRQIERPRSLEVHRELELSWSHDGKLRWLRPLEDLSDVVPGPAVSIGDAR
jgi:hypothetical protein